MKSWLAGIGTVGAAALAHVPCCGSAALFAFGGFGVSAGWLASLAPFRGYFFAFSVLMLGLGFWSAYKRPHACHSCGECATESHARRRVQIGAMWAVAALSVGLMLVGVLGGAVPEVDPHAGHDHGPVVHAH